MTKNNTTEGAGTANPKLFLAVGVFEIVISFVGSTGNLLTCFAVLRNKNLHHATNFYVLSLSMADFLVTSILVPVRAGEHLAIFSDSVPPSRGVIEVAVFIGRATILSSLASLSALSIDRYMALKYPIVYRVRIRYNFTRTLIIVSFLWVISLGLTTIPMFPGVSPFQGLIVFVVFVFIMTLIIFVTSWKILKLVKQLFNRLKKFRSTKASEETTYGDHFSFAKCSIFRNMNKIDMDRRGKSLEQKPYFSLGGKRKLAFDNNAFCIEQQPVRLLAVTRTKSQDDHENSSTCQEVKGNFSSLSENMNSKSLARKTVSTSNSHEREFEDKSLKLRGKPILAVNATGRLGGVSSLADGYIAKTIAIITCAFVICIYPRIVLILYHFAVKENQETRILRLWLKVLIYINSIVNPFLYAWRFRDFRREFFYLIRKLKRPIC